MSPNAGVGTVRSGRPDGIEPTTATPRSSRSSHHEITIDATTTISAEAARGVKRRRTYSDTSETTETTTVVPLTSPRSWTISHSCGSGSRASIESPSSLPSWPHTRITATPWM